VTTTRTGSWHKHEGLILSEANGFEVVDCQACGFAHVIPLPSEADLETAYRQDYYSLEKPDYIDRYREDLDWWNIVYDRRFEFLESVLPPQRRRLLDVGSGPGLFLLRGRDRGWNVVGIEPSEQAAAHSGALGLDVRERFYDERIALSLDYFDAINLGEVLEHLPQPAQMLSLIHRQLKAEGILCVIVPNDFNPFQTILWQSLGFKPWWIAPPHHLNYFNHQSLRTLLERCGFRVIHQESTFPIDVFLLMGDNYIGDESLGRACHHRRMAFERAVTRGGGSRLLSELYSRLADLGLGREIVMFAVKS